ncbi:MAG: molybdate ABC transporter substrate-binding protein, partial [Desulfobulbaceae bacterium]|nr:molybdate ABC transporter substrate-binding protein [Desulfobulbaceae bacterium]
MNRLSNIVGAVLLALLLSAATASATTISVAVATNFLRPLAQLAALFTKETGIDLQYSGSSSGKLYAQIKNGAPYDLFLAADDQRPELLHAAGLAEAPRVYARGEVVLWTRDTKIAAADWQQ